MIKFSRPVLISTVTVSATVQLEDLLQIERECNTKLEVIYVNLNYYVASTVNDKEKSCLLN